MHTSSMSILKIIELKLENCKSKNKITNWFITGRDVLTLQRNIFHPNFDTKTFK